MKTLRFLSLSIVIVGALVAAVASADEAEPLKIDVSGRAFFNMSYDSSLLAQDFVSYITDDTEDELNFNPRDTRLAVRASSREGEWTYGSAFEIDFYGDNNGNNLIPRLRLGYAEARNDDGLCLRGGQDWVPIAQQNPGTIDFGILSWSGNLWWRIPQFTMRYRSGGLEYLASAAMHRNSNAQEIQEQMPWFMGRIAAHDVLGENSLLALGGGGRTVTVDGNDYSPYLIAVELKTEIEALGITLNGEAYMGRGAAREFVHYGLDYNSVHPEGAREIESKGGFVNLKAPLAEKVDMNVGFGMDDPCDEDLQAKTDAPYLKNTTLYANLKIRASKRFGWGVEYMNIETTALDESKLTGSRATFAWWFIF